MNPTGFPRKVITERLTLRPPQLEHAEEMFRAWCSDPEVTRLLPWATHRDIEDTRGFIRFAESGWESGTEFTHLIFDRAFERPVGSVAFRYDGHSADFGYVLARPHWGKGFMTEALIPLLHIVRDNPHIHRLWTSVEPENERSRRLLERLGFKQEGVLRGLIVYPQLSPAPRDSLSVSITFERGDTPLHETSQRGNL